MENASQNTPLKNDETRQSGDGRLKAPIFLLGSHKSETSLLRALLDGHKDLFVFPTETHLFK